MVRTAACMGLGKQRVSIPLSDPLLFTNNSFYLDYIRDDPFLRQITIRLQQPIWNCPYPRIRTRSKQLLIRFAYLYQAANIRSLNWRLTRWRELLWINLVGAIAVLEMDHGMVHYVVDFSEIQSAALQHNGVSALGGFAGMQVLRLTATGLALRSG